MTSAKNALKPRGSNGAVMGLEKGQVLGGIFAIPELLRQKQIISPSVVGRVSKSMSEIGNSTLLSIFWTTPSQF